VITICDTGPLVAYLNRNDPYHSWAVTLMKQARPPMLTTDPVLTEVAYFLRTDRVDVDPLFQLLERGAVRRTFRWRNIGRGSALSWRAMSEWIWPTRRLSL
jgi:predicted nucleic acid-binding protein